MATCPSDDDHERCTKLTARHPSPSAMTHLVATEMIAVVMEQVGDLLYIDGVVEGGRVSYLTLVRRHFALQTLDQMTNGHSTGDGVGVDYDVGV